MSEEQGRPIRVLLVDDQELIRAGFRLVLQSEPGIDVVGEASDGETALEQLEALRNEGRACDVVLMDVRMPGMNGILATERIARDYPETRVLVLTTFDLDEYAIDAVAAGASGFLLKDVRPEELIRSIGRVAAGDAVMAPQVTQRLVEQLRSDAPQRAPKASAEFETLTDREREVLQLIGEGLNNTEIGSRLFLSESTVKTHVGRVLSKLQLRDRVQAVIFAKDHGL